MTKSQNRAKSAPKSQKLAVKTSPKALSKKSSNASSTKRVSKANSAVDKSPTKKASSPVKVNKPQWGPSYTKEITLYKQQADYFQLNQKYAKMGIATRCIHAGNEPDQVFGSVAPAIHLSSTFAQPAPGDPVVFDYARCGNPTRGCLERTLASMEHANYAFACSSGMAAHVTVMNLLKGGDHILCVDDVYGGTQRYLLKILMPNANIDVTLSDFSDIKEFKKQIRPNTKICWLETPTNPTLKCFDIKKIAEALKGTGVLLVVDNTFSTPINTNPLLLGADIVSHSLTKYIGGHSDVIAGALMLNDKELYDRLFFVMKSMGTGLSAFDSWIVLRGSKTLEVRVERAQQNAIAIAKLLEGHKKVERVVYPGLPSHPQYEMVKKQQKGPGAMISFYIKGGIKQAENFLKALKLFTLAESLGGVESLAENPALMTHFSVPPAMRKQLGIDDNFIRLSVGIETEADLLEDVLQALAKA